MGIRNNFVHIVESPSADDLLADRHEGGLLKHALELAGNKATYCLAANKQAFYEALFGRLAAATGPVTSFASAKASK